RPSLLLWLATLEDAEWVALDDLAGHLSARSPGWDRLGFIDRDGDAMASAFADAPSRSAQRRTARRRPAQPGTQPGGQAPASARVRSPGVLESVLLGVAYPFGLVRVAEERGSGRRLVQLTPLGRYVLTMGPTPPPRPTFDQ